MFTWFKNQLFACCIGAIYGLLNVKCIRAACVGYHTKYNYNNVAFSWNRMKTDFVQCCTK